MLKALFFAISGIIAGLVLISGYIDQGQTISGIKQNGTTASFEPSTATLTKNSGRYYVTYTAQFVITTATGQKVALARSLPDDVLQTFRASNPVMIRYMPNNPSEFVFAQEQPNILFLGLGLFFFCCGLAYMRSGWIKYKSAKPPA